MRNILTALASAWCCVLLSVAALAADSGPATSSGTPEQPMQISGKTDKLEQALVTVTQEVLVQAPPERAFTAFTAETAHWWGRDWLMGGKSTRDFVIDLQPGGAMREVYDDGGGMLWAEVIAFRPGKSIRFGVPPGVIWSGPGSISITFEPSADGAATVVKLVHESTQAYSADGHSGYVEGWTDLIGQRFKTYCEGGTVENAVN